MASKKQRVASVLKRFQFIDLARAVARTGSERESYLRDYVSRKKGRFQTYEPFRKSILGIYGVRRSLDPTPRPSRDAIEAAVKRACKGIDEAMNVDAALCLYDLVSDDQAAAFDHFPQSLVLGEDRRCSFRLEHYIVRGQEAVFQFPYPRRSRLSEFEYSVMMSLLHYGYVKGDFEEARVEIADLSCEGVSVRVDGQRQAAPRAPRVLQMPRQAVISREELAPEVQDIHRILMQIANEPDEES